MDSKKCKPAAGKGKENHCRVHCWLGFPTFKLDWEPRIAHFSSIPVFFNQSPLWYKAGTEPRKASSVEYLLDPDGFSTQPSNQSFTEKLGWRESCQTGGALCIGPSGRYGLQPWWNVCDLATRRTKANPVCIRLNLIDCGGEQHL